MRTVQPRTLILTGTIILGLAACASPEQPKPNNDFLYEERLSDTGTPWGDDTGTTVRPVETGEATDSGGTGPVVDMDGDGYSPADGDCDDADSDINPGAVEICDEIDNDCDGEVDNDAEDAQYFYPDGDADGYGDLLGATLACEAPKGTVPVFGDCDDTDSSVRPGASEWCDGVDDDSYRTQKGL